MPEFKWNAAWLFAVIILILFSFSSAQKVAVDIPFPRYDLKEQEKNIVTNLV